ncbi:type I-E CRISPR-associated protein Cse2/CasB [Streptomyces sp. NPDC091027]|uniref:type I-E CRISPR-associated protein Cse2/CasB n=1 Tax=Streptomyces sp. NPDC091027 TaxID=3365971 RepID=UPI00381CBA7C
MTTPTVGTVPRGLQRQQRAEEFVRQVLELCADSKRAQADLRSGLGLPYDRCQRMHRHLMRLVPDEMRHPEGRRPYYAVASLIAARSRRTRDEDAGREEAGQKPSDTAKEGAEGGAPTGKELSWWRRPNLGASLADAVNRGLMAPGSAESELHLLARTGSDSLHARLPALIGQVHGRGAVVDWAVLLEDLAWWDFTQDRIATRWLEAYFRSRDAAERAAEKAAASDDSNDDTSKETQ